MFSADPPEGPRLIRADARLVVVDKPSGLLAVPGRGDEKRDCVVARVEAAFGPVRVVHRLDRDTSGVMVLARDLDAQRELSGQFERREVTKRYIAIVRGSMDGETGRIVLPTRKDLERRYRHIVDHEQGREAITDWRVIERGEGWTRVELTPLTGRSHQLRVHLAALGRPIEGDPLYGEADGGEAPGRLMLHAESLTLRPPGDGGDADQRVTFNAPCPF